MEESETGWLSGSSRAQAQRKPYCPVVRTGQGSLLSAASQGPPLTGIRWLSSRSGLGHIPGKKSKGLSTCPQPNPGLETSRVPAALAPPPKPAASSPVQVARPSPHA